MDNQREILKAFKQQKISKVEAKKRLQENLGLPETFKSNHIDHETISMPLRRHDHSTMEPLAITGMAGRFPGADNVHEFWQNLKNGVDSVEQIPKHRWDNDKYYDPVPGKKGRICTRYAGFINKIDEFDPLFFKISPREAVQMDPQYRILLEESWKALEDAGCPPGSLSGRKIGMFVGGGKGDYPGGSIHLPSTEAGRISYLFDWKGPCICMETTCSSALVALNEACMHLWTGQIEMAVVGGVTLMTTPAAYLGFSQFSTLSPGGRCFSFDKRADGTIFSESVCSVVLKPLSAAVSDHDHVYGVIKGIGVNHDGKTNGLTAPCGRAQTELETDIYNKYNIDPSRIALVEAHGTGTKLGDPVEVNALIKAFDKFTENKAYCALGSVKANIGHAGAAAGLVGLIKTLLSIKYKKIPPMINFKELNPAIHLDNSPFYINTRLEDWSGRSPRMAAVSSFGFSGTNAHVVVEEYIPKIHPGKIEIKGETTVAIVLSAKNKDRLKVYARLLKQYVQRESYAAHRRNGSAIALENLAYTLQKGREAMEERVGLVVTSVKALTEKIDSYLNHEYEIPGLYQGRVQNPKDANALLGADRDVQKQLDQTLVEKDPKGILKLWIKGAQVDWNRLYTKNKPFFISLPTYPFARERYWIDQTPADKTTWTADKGEDKAFPAQTCLSSLEPAREKSSAGETPKAPVKPQGIVLASLTPDIVESGTIESTPQPGIVKPDTVQLTGIQPAIIQPDLALKTEPGIPEPTSGPTSESVQSLVETLTTSLARALYMAPETLDVSLPFIDMGLDSIISVEWIQEINREYGLCIPATKVYDYPTLDEFALFLKNEIDSNAPEIREEQARKEKATVTTTKTAVDLSSSSLSTLTRELTVSLAHALYMEPEILDISLPFIDMGLDSIISVEWIQQINKQYHINIPATKVYDYPDIGQLAKFLNPLIEKETGRDPAPLTVIALSPVKNEISGGRDERTRTLSSRDADHKTGDRGLGDPLFCQRYNCRLSYFAGSMYKGIASQDMVVEMAESGILSFFGSAGFKPDILESHIRSLQSKMGNHRPYGMCLVSNLNHPDQEMAHSQLFIKYGIPVIEAAAFSSMSPHLVLCRIKGLKRGQDGIIFPRRIIGKCSRLEVAKMFMSPPPAEVVNDLLVSGRISAQEAELAQHIPMADDIAVEADSGGHTDQGVAFSLIPSMVALRDEMIQRHGYTRKIMIGCGGGIGTPTAAAAAFALGAAFIFTGSINQCTRESGAHPHVKDLLSTIGIHDTAIAPASDMFEIGARAQVVKKGTQFAVRANKLLELFRQYDALTQIPETILNRLENDYFKMSISKIWESVCAYKNRHHPDEIRDALKNPRIKMKLIFQWYFSQTSRAALNGDLEQKDNFQIHSGPALGAFNLWVKGTSLESWQNRKVVDITNLLMDTAFQIAAGSERTVRSGVQDIAVIGMAGKFPQSPDLDKFWENLANKKSCIRQVPSGRWSVKAHCHQDDSLAEWDKRKGDECKENKCKGDKRKGDKRKEDECKWMGGLDDVDLFDPGFFNISPSEAEWMDPQQRLFLETAWHCMEDAGYSPEKLSGTKCGVFAGCGGGDYNRLIDRADLNARVLTGTSHSILPARVSYLLNLKGPSLAIDTACSSSLVAIAEACNSLCAGISDLAFAGGVSVLSGPSLHIMASKSGMLSRTGNCHTFDRKADGFVPGEGVGIILLKRLDDAIRDKDLICGVVKGWGVNQDGKTNGMTAPSANSQVALEKELYDRFKINPETISLVEAHGTGTILGDPVEVEALTASFRAYTDKKGYCALGSVKSNIGHLLSAAGISGVIKVLLALRAKKLPPTINFAKLNPHILLEESPFFINTDLQDWKIQDGQPRRAAVSSFGFSGTNAHLVIDGFDQDRAGAISKRSRVSSPGLTLAVVSARTEAQLTRSLSNLSAFLKKRDDIGMEDLAYTLQTGRAEFEYRACFVVGSLSDLSMKISRFLSSNNLATDPIENCFAGSVKKGRALSQWFEQDLDTNELIGQWIEKQRYDKIAQLWVKGVRINWNLFYPDGPPLRIRLPLYPFAGQSYWIPSSSEKNEVTGSELLIPSMIHLVQDDLEADSLRKDSLKKDDLENDSHARQIVLEVDGLKQRIEDTILDILFATFAARGWLGPDNGDEPAWGISKAYDRWFHETIKILISRGRKGVEEGFLPAADKGSDLDRAWARFGKNRDKWGGDPGFAAQANLLEPCLGFLPEILTGKKQVTSVMFPGSSTRLVEAVYKNNRAADYFTGILQDAAVSYLKNRLAADPEAKIRILEVGAGSGSTTQGLLTRFEPFKEHIIEYCYTDISKAFLEKARERFSTASYLTTKIFNIEGSALAQGIHSHSYDLVIASNVLHAVKNVCHTLQNIKPVIKKHGVMLVNEVSDHSLFAHTTFGLLKGWWLWEDAQIRIPGSPGLSPNTWEKVFTREGFCHAVFPARSAHGAGQQVIVVESDGIIPVLGQEEQGRFHAHPPKEPLSKPPEKGGEAMGEFQRQRVEDYVREQIITALCNALKIRPDEVEGDLNFSEYGVDSIVAVQIVDDFNEGCGLDLDTTIIFDYNCPDELVDRIVAAYPGQVLFKLDQKQGAGCEGLHESRNRHTGMVEQEETRPGRRMEDAGSKITQTVSARKDAIAIIGISGRFPKSDNLGQFWEHLINGDDLVEKASRWNLDALYNDRKDICRHGGFIDRIDRFDPGFFKISGREATYMDPQQRLFLEEAWKALEDAGYAGRTSRTQNCGVYAGCSSGDYPQLFDGQMPATAFWGNSGSVIPARIAYYLDLHGPAVAVDTSCSSSLVAVHSACQALWTREIDMALAGGVFLQSTPQLFTLGNEAKMLSPTGSCHAFDEGADGFVPGEGVGVILLKHLDAAVAQNDHIYGVIRASGINQDGSSNGITAPSSESQNRLQERVYQDFNINPELITLVEAHGTGTILGDPMEFSALEKSFGKFTDKKGFCALGSVKTNIGHAATAAGIAGIMKIVLAFQHKKIPPSLHYTKSNPKIGFENSPFYLNTEPVDWEVPVNTKRCAAISGFGFSGTNAHMVIEQAPEPEHSHGVKPGYLIVLSARTSDQLFLQAQNLFLFCKKSAGVDLGNMSFTLITGRKFWNYRLACVVKSIKELTAILKQWLENGDPSTVKGSQLKGTRQREDISLKRFGTQSINDCRMVDDPGRYLELLSGIGDLFTRGYRIAYEDLFEDGYARIPLPVYPFADESYWVAPVDPKTGFEFENGFESKKGLAKVQEIPGQSLETTVCLKPEWNLVRMEQSAIDRNKRVVLINGTREQKIQFHDYFVDAVLLDISPDDTVEQIVSGLRKSLHVDHLFWISPESISNPSSETMMTRGNTNGPIQVFRLAKALLSQDYGLRNLDFTLVTFRAQQVFQTDELNPEYAGVHGLAGSLAKEYPHWNISLFDLENETVLPIEEMGFLSHELMGETIALRANQWFSPILVPIEKPAKKFLPDTRGFRENGVYVVIGGAGGVGEVFSRFMIEKYKARIVWINRRKEDDIIRAKREALSKLGPTPIYISADASDITELEKVCEQVKTTYGHIHGVVHSAIVLADQSLALMDEIQFRSGLEPKTDISIALRTVFSKESLDFYLFFSSAQSFGRGAGQSNYAAGCTFKDAFAQKMAKELSCKVKIMNWGYWGNVGAVSDPFYQKKMERIGQGAIEPCDGMAALETLLCGPLNQMVFMKLTGEQGLKAIPKNDRVHLFTKKIPDGVPSIIDSINPVTVLNPAPGDATCLNPDRKMDELSCKILGKTLSSLDFLDRLDSGTRVPGNHESWLTESFRLVEKQGMIRKDQDGKRFWAISSSIDALWEEWGRAVPDWQQDAGLKAKSTLLTRCLERLPDVMTGKISPAQVLFPDGSMDLVQNIYQENPVAEKINCLMADAVAAFLESCRREPDRKVCILEIGAGTGGTTQAILKAITPYEDMIREYAYTDISDAFLKYGQTHYGADHPYLVFKRFDVAAPVESQGILKDRYDLIICSNVLHAVKNIRSGLGNAKAALHNQGILLVNELDGNSLFYHLTFGLLPGWWDHEDTQLRLTGSPAVKGDTWRTLLGQEGFSGIHFLMGPNDGPGDGADSGSGYGSGYGPGYGPGQQVWLCRSNGIVRQRFYNTVPGEIVPPENRREQDNTSQPASGEISKQTLSLCIKESLCKSLDISKNNIDSDTPFYDYGVDSILATVFVKEINENLGLSLKTPVLFEHATIASLCEHILLMHKENILLQPGCIQGNETSTIDDSEKESTINSGLTKIAVIGMSGQFPGAKDIHQFWHNLEQGIDSVVELPDRYLSAEHFNPVKQPGKSYCKWGGILEDRDMFDPLFFKITPREAESMTPHQRLVLEQGWKAIEDAGYDPKSLDNKKAGLFIGAEPTGYFYESFTGGSEAITASRLSYHLNLKGPAMVVNTGCSSSGTAIHLACESLRNNESEIVLAGGVFAMMGQKMLITMAQTQMLSIGGRCRPFDASADGTAFSEGVGIVVLKPLEKALADNDSIYGIIRGSGMNQDGKSNGITAPSGTAQEELIIDVYKRFDIDPEDISYVEAHGTGTRLGDPVEANALARAFKKLTPKKGFCAVGSAKSNIGHSAAASAVTGLIKILLSMKYGRLPRMLHFEELNPLIDFQESAFYINHKLSDWKSGSDKPLKAALNSFGHSGTNAHLVVEQYQDAPLVKEDFPTGPYPVLLSARTVGQLKEGASRLLDFIRETIKKPERSFEDNRMARISYTLMTGRAAMEQRLGFMARSVEELENKLSRFIAGKWDVDEIYTGSSGYDGKAPNGNDISPEQVNRLLEDRSYVSLVASWVAGQKVDWTKLYKTKPPCRMHLPSYPFARESYWMPGHDGKRSGECQTRDSKILLYKPCWKMAVIPPEFSGPPPVFQRHLVLFCCVGSEMNFPAAGVMEKKDRVSMKIGSKKTHLPDRFDDIALQVFEVVRDLLEKKEKVLVQLLLQSTPGKGEAHLYTALSGLFKTAHHENPVFSAQVIEIDPQESASTLDQKIFENSLYPGEVHIRYENHQRQVSSYEEILKPQLGEPPWKEDGLYLITGGQGALGLIFAETIAKNTKNATLILNGRSPLNLKNIKKIDELKALGANVEYRMADVSVRSQADNMIEGILKDHGVLNGVIHGAGIIKDNYVIKKSSGEFKQVLAPKVTGTLNLDRATKDLDLDFFVLFSSGAGAMGNPGQADYSTANAFMDAFACYRNDRVATKKRQGRTLSINWPLWQGGGMQVDDATKKMLLEKTGMEAMSIEGGIKTLVYGLGTDLSQVMAMAGDAAKLRQCISLLQQGNPPARKAAPIPDPIPDPISGPIPDRISDPTTDTLESRVLDKLKTLLSRVARLPKEKIGSRQPLEQFGLDSIIITEINQPLEQIFGPIPKTLFFEFQSLYELAQYFLKEYPGKCREWTGQGVSFARTISSHEMKTPVLRSDNKSQHPVKASGPDRSSGDIAIIGLSGHYPGADSLASFWENLKSARSCISEIPQERWSLKNFYEPDMEKALSQVKSYARHGGFLEEFAQFDPLFFNISPVDAFHIDPQERWVLTTCWEAMENAGYSRRLIQQQNKGAVGVFIGVTKSGFNLHSRLGGTIESSCLPSTSFSSMANRVSYHLNLTGPSMAIDTMCSSSVTAIHEACEHIRKGDCQMAIAGAVNMYLHPRNFLDLCLCRLLTDDPFVRIFSDQGKGFIPGEGVGAVLLKPLEKAIEDRDPIKGVIKGSGISHGGKTNGYMVPSLPEQQALIETVLKRARCSARDIQYIESAASGSGLGDAIEFEVMTRVFRNQKSDGCFIGSLKPDIGHLEAASGMSQLAKVIYQLQDRVLAPTRFSQDALDPSLPWQTSPLNLVTKPTPWIKEETAQRSALITSYGAGGSYGAMVVSEYGEDREGGEGREDSRPMVSDDDARHLFLLSARNQKQLTAYALKMRDHINGNELPFSSLAYTLQVGRDSFPRRLALVAGDPKELVEKLTGFIENRDTKAVRTGNTTPIKEELTDAVLAGMEKQAIRALATKDLTCLAGLWLDGFDDIAWDRLYGKRVKRLSLPGYPFGQQRFWYEPVDLSVEEGASLVAAPSRVKAPENTLEEQVKSLMREILFIQDREELDDNVNFIDLGLDSIRAVTFINKLSEKLGVPLRQTLVFDFPTLGTFVRHLIETKQIPEQSLPPWGKKTEKLNESARLNESTKLNKSSRLNESDRFNRLLGRVVKRFDEVVPLQAKGEGPILFAIHPMSGDVGLYAKLAGGACERFRLIGIRSRGFLSQKPSLTTIEEMARYNVRIITAIDPSGPYHLFGSSMGGAVAFETTRQLQLENCSVATLLMAEPPLVENELDARFWASDDLSNFVMNANFLMITLLHMDPMFQDKKRQGKINWSELEIKTGDIGLASGMDPKETVLELVKLITDRGVEQAPEILAQRLTSMAKIHLNNLKALNRYRPESLPVENLRSVLVRTQTARAISREAYNPDYLVRVQAEKGSLDWFFKGWKAVLPTLETVIMKGENHFDLLSSEDVVDELTEFLATVLDQTMVQKRGDISPGQTDTKIAVIGMSGRFPGADTLDEFWTLLENGKSAINDFPGNRGWDLLSLFSDKPAPLKTYVRRGGFLDEIDRFDPKFFNITPREARMMDPSERLFLQESYKAIEDAGIDPLAISGEPWGVFCGGGGDYNLVLRETTGMAPHITASGIAGRVSYSLNLTGPCQFTDAGCASSLQAVAQACDHLMMNKCDVAVAGGVLTHSTPNLIVTGCQMELFSPSSKSGSLSGDADGQIPGEAVAVVILKPLDRALDDNDRIYGIIEGWGSNHNGRTNGMAAPSMAAQEKLFSSVYEQFGIDPGSIGMVEANATGTKLGDTMEIEALSRAFKKKTQKNQFCAIGSVENNVGHGFQVSGMVHLIKVLMSLTHGVIPGTLNGGSKNPELVSENSPFFVNPNAILWDTVGREGVRRAAVSSFGATGTNIHMVLRQGPVFEGKELTSDIARPCLVLISARNKNALKLKCAGLLDHVNRQKEIKLHRLCATLILRRHHFSHRCAFAVRDAMELKSLLTRIVNDDLTFEHFTGETPKKISLSTQRLGQRLGEKTLDAILNGSAGMENFEILADLCLQGCDPDMTDCFSKEEKQPVSIPAYPFDQRQCWVGTRKENPLASPPIMDDRSLFQPSSPPSFQPSGLDVICGMVAGIAGFEPDEVDTRETFGEIGFDSLMSMRMIAMVNEHYFLDIHLVDVLEENTIEKLARFVDCQVQEKPETQLFEKSGLESYEGSSDWFLRRCSQMPSLDFFSIKTRPAPIQTMLSSAGMEALNWLVKNKIALFKEPNCITFVFQKTIDIISLLDRLGVLANPSLFSGLAEGTLIAPVTGEQERTLYHSEVMKLSSWNVQHIYEVSNKSLDLDLELLNRALARVVEHHDLLRTCFMPLDNSFAQVIIPETSLSFNLVEMEALETFQSFILNQRDRLIDVTQLPVFKCFATRIGKHVYLAFVTHHSLADAFTPGMIFSELMGYYGEYEKGEIPKGMKADEQYWQYGLIQADPVKMLKAKAFWKKQLKDRSLFMNLPHMVDPATLEDKAFHRANGCIHEVNQPLCQEIQAFSKQHDLGFSQLFTYAVMTLLSHGPGNENGNALVQVLTSNRNRASLMNIPGDFTQPLFLRVKTDPQAPILDQLRALKYESHQAMAYSNIDFKDLMAYSGVDSYQAYFTQGDVVIDSTDVDAATLNFFQGPGRSLFFKTLTDQSQAPEEGQAISTLFFQILKMEEQIHLITTFRENLFEKSVVEELARQIIQMVEYMVEFPTKTVGQMVSSIWVPGFPVTPGSSGHPGISLTSRPEKKKEVPMDSMPLREFKDKTVIRMLEQLEKGLISIEEVERIIGGNDK